MIEFDFRAMHQLKFRFHGAGAEPVRMAPRKQTDDFVRAVRAAASHGATAAELALRFGLSRSRIYEIVAGRSYPDAGGPIRASRPRLSANATVEDIHREGRRRLLARSNVVENGCWHYATGAKGSRGYFVMSLGGREQGVHRWAYECFVGHLEPGHEVDHACHGWDEDCFEGDDCLHRRCVRPDHLRQIPHSRNVREGRCWATHGLKTACPHGHQYDQRNTRYKPLPSGGVARVCRACARDYMRRRRSTHGADQPGPPMPDAA